MSNRFGETRYGTVLDCKTGLEWQAEPTGPMTWEEAQDYAESLDLAGHDDWQLPTRLELETLVDLDRYNPASAFPGMPNKGFWSSSVYVDNTSSAWHVIFNDGYVYDYGKNNSNHVRCVRRSAEKEETVSNRFEETRYGTVLDCKTGLEWQAEPTGLMGWQEAQDYAEELDLGGYNDWRLPTRLELETLLDLDRHSPASAFPGMPSEGFWSSSVVASYTSFAWRVGFGGGYVGYGDKDDNDIVHVRCVRRSV